MAFIGPALASISAAASSAAASTAAAATTATATIGSTVAGGLTTAGGTLTATLPGAVSVAGATIPGWVGYATTGLSALSGVTGAVGSLEQGQAQAEAAKYNANIEKQNAAISLQNANIAGQAGEAQAAKQEMRTRAEVGAIKANQAAAGIDVNQGSAVDVRSSASELGQLDAMTIRSNAARQAYGYRNQAASETAASTLSDYTAKNASTAGAIGAASTFLGGAAQAGSNWMKYQLQGGLGYAG